MCCLYRRREVGEPVRKQKLCKKSYISRQTAECAQPFCCSINAARALRAGPGETRPFRCNVMQSRGKQLPTYILVASVRQSICLSKCLTIYSVVQSRQLCSKKQTNQPWVEEFKLSERERERSLWRLAKMNRVTDI